MNVFALKRERFIPVRWPYAQENPPQGRRGAGSVAISATEKDPGCRERAAVARVVQHRVQTCASIFPQVPGVMSQSRDRRIRRRSLSIMTQRPEMKEQLFDASSFG